jgi:hypothetical protein
MQAPRTSCCAVKGVIYFSDGARFADLHLRRLDWYSDHRYVSHDGPTFRSVSATSASASCLADLHRMSHCVSMLRNGVGKVIDKRRSSPATCRGL